jgi:hypothetical protein
VHREEVSLLVATNSPANTTADALGAVVIQSSNDESAKMQILFWGRSLEFLATTDKGAPYANFISRLVARRFTKKPMPNASAFLIRTLPNPNPH